MKRTREEDLEAWAGLKDRKPLNVRGARQVGKSFLVKSWGEQRFQTVAEANLERRPELAA
jgi:predicted AAA+ superfamily ATPase